MQLAPQVPREAWPQGHTQDRRIVRTARRLNEPSVASCPPGSPITPPHVMSVPVGFGVKSRHNAQRRHWRKNAQAHLKEDASPTIFGVKPPSTTTLGATPASETHGPQGGHPCVHLKPTRRTHEQHRVYRTRRGLGGRNPLTQIYHNSKNFNAKVCSRLKRINHKPKTSTPKFVRG